MAPEQLLGQATDARTDQFAFGVLLYEMLAGHHPFGSGALPTTIAKVLSAELDPADIPGPLWEIVQRATQKQPEDRFATTAELLAALTNASGTSAPPHLSHPSTVRTLRTVRTIGTVRWWEVHQLVVALSYWFMVWPAWHVHKWTGARGVPIFLVTLAIVIVGGNTRLHLWFTSRTFPRELEAQRADVARIVRAADIAFSLMMLATGLTIAGEHTGWGALFVSFGLGGALAFLVIEPATARAAFRK
jgi:hypothetical protein